MPIKIKLLFAIEKTAIIFWVATIIIGDMTSVFAWGGISPDSISPDSALDEKAKIGTNAYHTAEKSRWTR